MPSVVDATRLSITGDSGKRGRGARTGNLAVAPTHGAGATLTNPPRRQVAERVGGVGRGSPAVHVDSSTVATFVTDIRRQ
jgi:hypothetical protein